MNLSFNIYFNLVLVLLIYVIGCPCQQESTEATTKRTIPAPIFILQQVQNNSCNDPVKIPPFVFWIKKLPEHITGISIWTLQQHIATMQIPQYDNRGLAYKMPETTLVSFDNNDMLVISLLGDNIICSSKALITVVPIENQKFAKRGSGTVVWDTMPECPENSCMIDVDWNYTCDRRPIPSNTYIPKIGIPLTFNYQFKGVSESIKWHLIYNDGTSVFTLPKVIMNYTLVITLEEFDNNTNLQCILPRTNMIMNSPVVLPTPTNSANRGIDPGNLPVIYFNNPKNMKFDCYNNDATLFTYYEALIKDKKLYIIRNRDYLSKNDSGSIIACLYFKRIQSEHMIKRYVENKHLFIYKDEQDTIEVVNTTTTTELNIMSEKYTVTTAVVPVSTLKYDVKEERAATSHALMYVGCGVGVMSLLIVAAIAYKTYRTRKDKVSSRSSEARPRPLPPVPSPDLADAHEYHEITYQETPGDGRDNYYSYCT